MRPASLDPTAGERARQMRLRPDVLLTRLDPTDPRCGKSSDGTPEHSGERTVIVDPTSPRYGKPAA